MRNATEEPVRILMLSRVIAPETAFLPGAMAGSGSTPTKESQANRGKRELTLLIWAGATSHCGHLDRR